jgi:hypothetical protein
VPSQTDQAGTAQPCFVGVRTVGSVDVCWDGPFYVLLFARLPVPFRGAWCDVSNFRFGLIVISFIDFVKQHENPVQLGRTPIIYISFARERKVAGSYHDLSDPQRSI